VKNYISRKLKQNKAFSLAETLIVVAILVVLMGIGMPLIGNWQSKLDMTELDNHAKTVFLEAQNQLIAKRVEGSLPALEAEMKNSYGGNALTTKPYGFDDSFGDSWQQLYYIDKNVAATIGVVPSVSNTYQMDGYYIVEFNPLTGDVYSAFYKESAIDYANDIEGKDRSATSRAERKIGYYGGKMESTIETLFILEQDVELINSEELYLRIAYDYSAILNSNLNKLNISCLIKDENGGSKTISLNGLNTPHTIEGKQIVYYVLLDSMQESNGFKEITGLHAGDNITIDVAGKFDFGEYSSEANTNGITGNSLFASRTEDGSKIEIGAVRHLRNLDSQYYVHSSNNEVKIVQVDNIDFNNEDYRWNGNSYDKTNASRPFSILSPINNASLFGTGTERKATKTIISGNNGGFNYKIQNFVIEGVDNVGIFGAVSNTDFTDVKIEDSKVTGSGNNVGGLAGSVLGGTVSNCGVYLTTYTGSENGKNYYWNNPASETTYADEMDERYNKRTVSGGSNVGGMFGFTNGVNINNSFAAIQTKGSNTVGGFIGNANDTTITNAYSSGDVLGVGNIYGGFIGNSYRTNVTNAYSTSDMYVNDTAGGFAGVISGGEYNKCYSYGEVLKSKDSSVQIPTNAGQFTSSSTATLTDCKYLRQQGYNTATGFKNITGVESGKYGDFTAESNVGVSYPYDMALGERAFPFNMVVDNHYGNWPTRYVIDTALVYYERYEDGTYGYYCETRVSSRDEDATTNQDYIWVLDSLQDRECIEDGYALLSMYRLTKFSYQLTVGSQVAMNAVNLTVTTEGAGTGKAVMLRQQGALTFKGYDGEADEANDVFYESMDVKDSFSVSGMYLYQLPYDLQCPDRNAPNGNRNGITSFYDKLVVYAGYADSTLVIGSDAIDASAKTFYYCPHFAKTAMNPDTTIDLANPPFIYLRSARQLNALGRHPYYWNAKRGYNSNLKVYFKQESDINFGTYTETYCGNNYEMLVEGNAVANVPIGVTNEWFTDSAQQFMNSYDGQGYKIIDYGVSGSYQFMGLFGDIMDADIKNVVMTVSDTREEKRTQKASEKKVYLAGKVISRCYSMNFWEDLAQDEMVAVGALVGRAYMTGNTIENCASAGYDVEHDVLETTESWLWGVFAPNRTDGLILGGLVGSSFSKMSNCSAVNNITLVGKDNTEYSKPVFIGGLVGSFGYGIHLQNSYAGGTIDIIRQGEFTSGTIAVGGVCPGWLSMYAGSLNGTYNVAYRNLYSYVTYKQNLKNNLDPIDYKIACIGTIVSGTAGNQNKSYEHCYYLEPEYEDIREYIAESVNNGREKGTPITNWELKNLKGSGNELANRVTSYPNNAGNAEKYTYPVSLELRGIAYPYPTVNTRPVFNDDNIITVSEHVHYGDWPENTVYYKALPAYYEKYDNGSYGVYAVYHDGEVVNRLYSGNTRRIVESGYGVLQLEEDTSKELVFKDYVVDKRNYYFYKLNLATNPEHIASVEGTFSFELVKERKDANGNTIVEETVIDSTLYGNPEFAAAISIDEDLGYSSDNPLQVRTVEQLKKAEVVKGENNEDVYMKQTFNLYPTADYVPITIREGYYYDGGSESGNQIYGAVSNIFDTNNGTISNCEVAKTQIKQNNTQIIISQENVDCSVTGFVKTNAGEIDNCTVVDPTIVPNIQIADNIDMNTIDISVTGFADTNTETGKIANSGVYGTNQYGYAIIKGNRAAGFINNNQGEIRNCYVAGTITAEPISNNQGAKTAVATGFAESNEGIITLSYANSKVTANGEDGIATGFAVTTTGTISDLTECYSIGTVEASTVNGTACGFITQGPVSECYTLSTVLANQNKMYGFASNGITEGLASCYWVCDDVYGYNVSINGQNIGVQKTLWEIHAMTDYEEYLGMDYPYESKLKSSPYYIYPSVGIAHYGNWPIIRNAYVDNMIKNNDYDYTGMFYYEQYKDGSYGIYAIGQRYLMNDQNEKIEGIINTLSINEANINTVGGVKVRGYGIFYKTPDDWAVANSNTTNNNAYTSIDNYVNSGTEMTDKAFLHRLGLPEGYNFYMMQSINGASAPASYLRNFRYTYYSSWLFGDSYSYSLDEITLDLVAGKRNS